MWRVLLAAVLVAVTTCEPLRFAPSGAPSSTPGTIICPDRMGTCPAGSTCCKLASGRYGCCSFAQATCCSDHLHCCPHGYKCDVAMGTCNLGDISIPMVPKQPAQPMGAINHGNDVVCPGGQSYCPGSDTCCKLKSGSWGCCPLSQAVCCSDGTHCCPAGYKCDSRSATCTKGANQNTWFTVGQAKALPATAPGKPSSGKPASSPQSKIEPSEQKQPQSPKKKRNVCPGGKMYCDAGRTCCYQNNSNFGCCSYVNGTCCSDMKHCCPLGYNCDLKLGKCTKGGGLTLPWGETHDSKSNDPEPEEPGPSIFRTLLSLLLDTFIDYDQDDDDDERDKTKRGKTTATASMETSKVKVTVTAGKGSNPKVKTRETKRTQKSVQITTAKRGQAKKCILDKNAKHPKLVTQKGSKSAQAIDAQAQQILAQKVKANAAKAKQKQPQILKTPPKIKFAASREAKKPIPKVVPKVAPKVFPKVVPKQMNKPADSKVSPSTSKTSSGIHKKTAQAKQNAVIKPNKAETTAKPSKETKAAKKPTKPKTLSQGNKHDKPLSKGSQKSKQMPKSKNQVKGLKPNPTPSLQQKLQAKKIIEPKTSTRLDEGKPKHPPMVPQRAKLKPRVKSVLKPISKPPQVVKKTAEKPTAKKPVAAKMKPKIVGVKKTDKRDLKPSPTVIPPKSSGPMAQKDSKPAAAKVNMGIKTANRPQTIKCIAVPSRNSLKSAVPASQKGPSLVKSATNPIKKATPSSGVKKPITASAPGPPTGKPSAKPTAKGKATSSKIGTAKPKANTAARTPTVKVIGNPILARHLLIAKQRKRLEKLNDILKTLSASQQSLASSDFIKNSSQEPTFMSSGSNLVCPDGHSTCPDTGTCCMLPTGEWGCCPMQQAVCCSDNLHCCPSGTTCDVSAGTCLRSVDSQPMTKLTTLESDQVASESRLVMCSDDVSTCADGFTCCQVLSGEFMCCPLPEAVCCSDDLHCCPYNTECNVEKGTCDTGTHTLPWVTKQPALPRPSQPWLSKVPSTPKDQVDNPRVVMCLDEISTCPDDYTCCQVPSGVFKCCPMLRATCCLDHEHCCPEDTMCNLKNGTCEPLGAPRDSAQTLPHVPSVDQSGDSIMCDDKKTTCQEGTTCCKMLDGYYSCCPFSNAVCCPDKLHCCPHDETCDIKRGRCVSGSAETPWGLKLPPTPPAPTPRPVEGVVCPGGQIACPTGSTCCQESAGVYACCPLAQAVCCSDHVHCCPHGYACDVAAGTCTSASGSIPLYTKSPPLPLDTSSPPQGEVGLLLGNVICPDKQSFCPDRTTCCKLTSGQYGCCPLPQAMCCADNVHCCPNGYTCDTKHASCLKAADRIPWSEKMEAQPISGQVGAVVCPDKKSHCQDGQTCCLLTGKVWGCCPIPKAVCCSDGVHCCPSGMTCDTKTGMCLSSSNSLQISMATVHRTFNFVSEDTAVGATQTCKDKTECPQGSTCCEMTSGKYGCCPYPSGTCCKDKVHCCPGGFVCDVTGTHCEKKGSSLKITSTMFTRLQASPPGVLAGRSGDNAACPGGQVACQSGQTCCLQQSGSYACCPFANAVCCSDQVHCCPQGYACDTQTGTCTQSVPWVSKTPAVARQPALTPVTGVVCPDRIHECPDGNTCCRLVSGEWGCCPLVEAVCCTDGQHCCPHGYHCSTQAGTCLKTVGNSQTWQQASPISIATAVEYEED